MSKKAVAVAAACDHKAPATPMPAPRKHPNVAYPMLSIEGLDRPHQVLGIARFNGNVSRVFVRLDDEPDETKQYGIIGIRGDGSLHYPHEHCLVGTWSSITTAGGRFLSYLDPKGRFIVATEI